MRIAVVGAGIAGMASAWLLSRQHQVVLFEAGDRLGGHTHTHDIELAGRNYARRYRLHRLQQRQLPAVHRHAGRAGRGDPADHHDVCGAQRAQRAGVQRRHQRRRCSCRSAALLSPRHWRMIADILRFYRQSPALLANPGDGPSLGDYLDQHGYSAGFRDDHLVPMASALWSSPSAQILHFPAKYLVAVHGQPPHAAGRRPAAMAGGARRLEHLCARAGGEWTAQVRLCSPVRGVRRHAQGVDIATDAGTEVLRPDGAGLPQRPGAGPARRSQRGASSAILGRHALPAQRHRAAHRRLAAAARPPRLGARGTRIIPREAAEDCTVSYCMNLLQSLDAPEPFVVTLNRTAAIDPARSPARA